MEVRPHRIIRRKITKKIKVGNVYVGGDSPISVQSMTNTLTTDVKETINQINSIQEAGADIVRVSCPDESSTKALKEIIKEVSIPIVADIHFHYKVAKLHAEENKLQINYLNTSPEKLNEIEKFDIILNLEIVEHVDNVNLFIKSCNKLLKKNGLMFTATLNRSFTSYIKAIIGAEYIMRWLPIGTHDWNKFIKPEELEEILTKEKFSTIDVKGLKFNPFLKKWKRSNDLSVNYIINSLKN